MPDNSLPFDVSCLRDKLVSFLDDANTKMNVAGATCMLLAAEIALARGQKDPDDFAAAARDFFVAAQKGIPDAH